MTWLITKKEQNNKMWNILSIYLATGALLNESYVQNSILLLLHYLYYT